MVAALTSRMKYMKVKKISELLDERQTEKAGERERAKGGRKRDIKQSLVEWAATLIMLRLELKRHRDPHNSNFPSGASR